MKKMIFSSAAIVVTFMGFAFTPAEKNNAINQAKVSQAPPAAEERCDEDYDTSVSFSKCHKVYTTKPEVSVVLTSILDNY